MKVTPEYLVLLVVILFSLYAFNAMEKWEAFSVCTQDQVKKAYKSPLMKPRRPEHMECTTSKDDKGTEKKVCKRKIYNKADALNIFRVDGVPDDCLWELIDIWKW
jgi:hypothetical protein